MLTDRRPIMGRAGRVPLAMGAAALLLLHGVMPSAASVQTFAGYDPNNPLRSAVQRLAADILSQCRGPGRPEIVLAMFGVLPHVDVLSDGQKRDLNHQIDSFLSDTLGAAPGMSRQNMLNNADLVQMMGAGRSREAVEALIRSSNERWNISVMADVARVGDAFRVTLRAVAALGRGLDCSPSVGPFPVPATMIPEPVQPPDVLMGRAARTLLDALSNRDQTVAVRARFSGEHYTVPQLNEHFASALNRGLTRERSRGTQIVGGNQGRVLAVPVDHADRSAQPWDMDVVLRRGSGNAIRIEIEMRPPQDTPAHPMAYDGLIAQDEIPALPASFQVRDHQLALPGAVGAALAAPQLPLATDRRRLPISLHQARPRMDYGFRLDRGAVIELDLDAVEGVAPPMIRLFNQAGREVAPAPNVRTRSPHVRRYRLAAGTYLVSVATAPTAPVEAVLLTRGSYDVLSPLPEARELSQVSDWHFGRAMRGNACFAYTAARSVTPVTWRLQAPSLYFQITPGSDEVFHFIDNAEFYQRPESVTAEVILAGGRRERLPLMLDNGRFQAGVPCRDGVSTCTNPDFLYNLTQGLELILRGVPKGQANAGEVRYSLRGYQSAISNAALECNQTELARSLILNRRMAAR